MRAVQLGQGATHQPDIACVLEMRSKGVRHRMKLVGRHHRLQHLALIDVRFVLDLHCTCTHVRIVNRNSAHEWNFDRDHTKQMDQILDIFVESTKERRDCLKQLVRHPVRSSTLRTDAGCTITAINLYVGLWDMQSITRRASASSVSL